VAVYNGNGSWPRVSKEFQGALEKHGIVPVLSTITEQLREADQRSSTSAGVYCMLVHPEVGSGFTIRPGG